MRILLVAILALSTPLCAFVQTDIKVLMEKAVQEGRSGTAPKDAFLTYHKATVDEIAERLHISADEVKAFEKEKDIAGAIVFELSKLPKNAKYTLFQAKLNGLAAAPSEWIVNDDGIAVSAVNPMETLDQFMLFHGKFLPGEPIKVILIKEKEMFLLGFKYIPNPIENSSPSQRVVSAELLTVQPCTYMVNFSGFSSKEKVEVTSYSSGEKIVFPLEIPENGELTISCSPAVIGQTGGLSELTVKSELTSEILSVKLPWGDQKL